jgi:hypothetical protein
LINVDLSDEIQRAAPGSGTPSLIRRMEVIQEALWNLDRNANRQITLEAMLLDLCTTENPHGYMWS